MVSLTKSAVRPAANVATAGVAAPVLSTIEDVISVGLVFVAILIPALVLVVLVALVWAVVKLCCGAASAATEQAATGDQPSSRKPD